MPDRAACQRRVYRLALLLTGRGRSAMQVVRDVVDAQPRLDNIDSAHLDRLTVLRSREHPHRAVELKGMDEAVATAVADLPAQQREAWVFARVYRIPQREMARAMDCSITATQRHLELAEQALNERLGSDRAAGTPGLLLKITMTLDVPRVYRARQRRRQVVRIAAYLLIMALVIAAVIVIWWWLTPA